MWHSLSPVLLNECFHISLNVISPAHISQQFNHRPISHSYFNHSYRKILRSLGVCVCVSFLFIIVAGHLKRSEFRRFTSVCVCALLSIKINIQRTNWIFSSLHFLEYVYKCILCSSHPIHIVDIFRWKMQCSLLGFVLCMVQTIFYFLQFTSLSFSS